MCSISNFNVDACDWDYGEKKDGTLIEQLEKEHKVRAPLGRDEYVAPEWVGVGKYWQIGRMDSLKASSTLSWSVLRCSRRSVLAGPTGPNARHLRLRQMRWWMSMGVSLTVFVFD
jgi:hypothetical protein